MSRKNLYLFLGITLLFTACSLEEEDAKDSLPSATGELSQVVVIYDQYHNNQEFEDQVAEVFGKAIDGLPPPPEAKFSTIVTDETHFKGYFKYHHNVFILLTEDNLEGMEKTYGAKNKDKIKEIINKPDALGFTRTDLWSNNQSVFYITAKDHKSLLAKMQERSEELIEIASEHERRTGARMTFNQTVKADTFYQKTLKERGYALRLPGSYRVAINNYDFVWLRKEASKYDYGIFLYEVPYVSQEQFKVDSIISLRTRYTKKYVPGEVEGSYMAVSDSLRPVVKEVNFNDRYAVNARGWWNVKGDWMGGPFVSYLVYDEKNARIVVAEGFVYGPNKPKARPLREIEIILNSLHIHE